MAQRERDSLSPKCSGRSGSRSNVGLPEEVIVETIAATHRVHLREYIPTSPNDRVLIAGDRKLEHARPAAIAEVVHERLNAYARKKQQDLESSSGLVVGEQKNVCRTLRPGARATTRHP